MHGTLHRFVLRCALAATALLLVATATASAAVTRTFAPAPASHGAVVVFETPGIAAGDVTGARLVRGARSWALSRRTVKRGIRRGRVRTRVRGSRKRLRLRIRMAGRVKTGGRKGGGGTTTDGGTTTTTGGGTTTTTGGGTTTTTGGGTTTTSPDTSLLGLRPPGSPALADADAAALVKRSTWEPRPLNATANNRRPTDTELLAYRAAAANWGNCNGFHQKVTGNFAGTTDEIIQWAAAKWGFGADELRAVASVESWWHQSAAGDNGVSFGLMQVKSTVHTGTFPLSRDSTAFNADFYGAMLRYYYDGCATWLNTVERVGTYAAGDFWGSVGAWYAGRWHTAAAEGYITKVKNDLAARTWLSAGF